MLKAALITTLLTTPAQAACHHYATWNYPYPQSCGIAHRAAEAKVWYVQIELPSAIQSAEAAQPKETDQRTAAQIRDFEEHNATVTKYRAELNNQFEVLKVFQAYQLRLKDTTGADAK